MTKVKDTRLVKNALKCLKCGDILESKHRHDYKTCSCDNAMIDGGLDYQRWGWRYPDSIEDLSVSEEYEREPYEWEKNNV